MSQALAQGLQQDLMKQKLHIYHINSLLQGDKSVVYEDVNLKIGCVRQIQKQPGLIQVGLKLFIRNQNTQGVGIVNLALVPLLSGQPDQRFQIVRASRPIPIQQGQAPPLNAGQTLDLDMVLKWQQDIGQI